MSETRSNYVKSDAIPLSPTLEEATHEIDEQKGYAINKRVLYLSLQAVFNAVLVGCVAKLLVALINFITNIAFYGKFSFGDASPAYNHLGLAVIILPVVGGLIVGVMAGGGAPAGRGRG